jgi:hypothetical protein
MVKLVATQVLGTCGEIRGGSSPSTRTKIQKSEEVIGLERCFKAHYEGHYNTEPELLNRYCAACMQYKYPGPSFLPRWWNR